MDSFELLSRIIEILRAAFCVFMKCLLKSSALSGLEHLFLPFPACLFISPNLKDSDNWSPQLYHLPYTSMWTCLQYFFTVSHHPQTITDHIKSFSQRVFIKPNYLQGPGKQCAGRQGSWKVCAPLISALSPHLQSFFTLRFINPGLTFSHF